MASEMFWVALLTAEAMWHKIDDDLCSIYYMLSRAAGFGSPGIRTVQLLPTKE
jgi:hypothetical protein